MSSYFWKSLRQFRFHLRALLVFVASICISLGWIAAERRQSRIEHEIASQLRVQGFRHFRFGGPYDSYDRYTNGEPQGWWRDLARVVLGERVIGVGDGAWFVSDISTLSGLRNVQELDVSGTEIRDFSPLSSLDELRDLNLAQTHISTASLLVSLTKLQHLSLNETEVTEIEPLGQLKELKYLWLLDTRVRDVTPLSELEKLEMLEIGNYHEISDAQIEALKKALPHCSISDFRIEH